MFKILIKKFIDMLDLMTKEFKRAYDETYGLSDLSKEFIDKVEEIKTQNKKDFMEAAEAFERFKGLASFEFPTNKQIKERVKQHWKEALQNGNLDELYRPKERK